jgi:hypothetical protein
MSARKRSPVSAAGGSEAEEVVSMVERGDGPGGRVNAVASIAGLISIPIHV